MYKRQGLPRWRGADDVRGVLNGYELAEPGLVQTARWRPEPGTDEPGALEVNAVSAVGLLVSRPVPTELGPVR